MIIHVTYRATRQMSIRVGRRGDVRVSAPYGVSRAEVQRFVEEHREWIDGALARVAEQARRRREFFGRLPLRSRADCREVSERLRDIVAPMIERHSAEMGVSPTEVSFRTMETRWGSCATRTRRISLSVYLLLLPEWCIEHVVVHELAHLIVPNHSPRFYAVMDRHFPQWREARATTRRLANLDEEE